MHRILTKKIAALVLLILIIGLVSLAFSPDLSYDTFLEQGSMSTEATYIIFKDGSTYYARNGATGEIESSSNCSYLVQTLIDEGENGIHINFKHGVFYIDSTISISKSVRLTGEMGTAPWGDLDSTTLSLTANTTMFLYNHTSHIFVSSFAFLTLDGNNMTATESVPYWENDLGVGNLVKMLGNISDVTFDHVAFFNCGTEALAIYGVYGNIWNIWVQRCWIEENFAAGIGMMSYNNYRVERVIIQNNHFYDNMIDIAISDDNVNDVLITENTSELTQQNFVRVYNSGRDVTASNNQVYDGGCESTGYSSAAFWLNETDHSIFSNNIIKNLENDTAWEIGFYLTKCDYNEIVNNLIYNLTSSGIHLEIDSDWNLISGNIVTDNDVNGVDIDDNDCDYNAVLGVVANGNTGVDIEDSGTNTEIHSCWNGTNWIT